jgi:hypothetical protein
MMVVVLLDVVVVHKSCICSRRFWCCCSFNVVGTLSHKVISCIKSMKIGMSIVVDDVLDDDDDDHVICCTVYCNRYRSIHQWKLPENNA